ncbi:Smg-4/UPF3 family-domain-containing protein [Cytidiella melzeri]|nr:Smg-4/UPF3 family-domain-containing protein [Cytidiella melzeri]
MATAESATSNGTYAKTKSKEKEKERKRLAQKSQSSSDRLKTVVRRLPPNLPEEVFWKSVQSWVTEDTVVWKEYHLGKFRKRINKENIPSRAYIAFTNEDILATFSREYDGHVFRDKAGNESIAIVEFAPFQKVPTGKGKADSRMATIERDEDFISFMESLKEPQTKPLDLDSLDNLIADKHISPPPTTTPLLEALKAEKSAQKDKEAIIRNHAHYKDMKVAATSTPAGAKRDVAKKKAGSDNHPPSKGEEPPTSKKAAKKAAAAAAKAASQAFTSGAAQPKDTSAPGGGPSNPPAKSKAATSTPKSQRTNRDRGGSKGASSATAQASKPEPSNNPSEHSKPEPPKSELLVPGAPSEPGPAASSSRRGRPVIGLGSRQFEAALSGAVGGGKPKREKDNETTVPTSAAAGATSPKSRPSQVPSATSAVVPHTILRRDGPANPIPAGVIVRPPPEGAGQTIRDDGAGGAGRGHRGRGRGRGGRGGRGG